MEMKQSAFTQIRGVLESLPVAVDHLAVAYKHEPVAGSNAAADISRFPEAADTAYSQASMAITLAQDHMFALERALQEPISPYAPWSLCRVVVESTATAMWLLEMDISAEERISRSMNLRLSGLEEQRKILQDAIKSDNQREEELSRGLDHVRGQKEAILADAKVRGVPTKTNSKQRVIGFGSGLPSKTSLVESQFGDSVVYRLLSAAAHGESWAMIVLGSTIQRTRKKMGLEPELTLEKALYLIVNSIPWYTSAVWRFFTLHGWDLAALASTLDSQYDLAYLKQDLRFWRTGQGQKR